MARGFSALEAMIVVAVISALAGIAIPQFNRWQLKAWQTEVFTHLNAIATAERTYEFFNEAFVPCGVSPPGEPDANARPFDRTRPGWSQLEWTPDGAVRCHYSVEVLRNGGRSWARPTAVCDLDGDGRPATWYIDVDPYGVTASGKGMAPQPSPITAAEKRY